MEPLPPFLTDWFTEHIPVWEKHLQHMRNQPHLRFLEIGSWEGKSAVWLLQNILTHESARLTCIDHFPVIGHETIRKYAEVWGLKEPYPEQIDIEERFDANVRSIGAGQKVIKCKGMSQELLRGLPLHTFDMVYVDGSHHAPDALRDIVLSWDLLKEDGMMIMDDYMLENRYAMGNPQSAIDGFLTAFDGQYQLLHKDWQVILKKTTRYPRATDHPAVGIAWNTPVGGGDRSIPGERTGVASITMARNEEDILKSFVRHHATIIDRMIIVLHRCTDASWTILQKLTKEGFALDIRESNAAYYAQSEVLTGILHELSGSHYRWVLPLDADEFLCDSNGDAKTSLIQTQSDDVWDIPWKTYVPTPEDNMHENDPLLRITHRCIMEPRQFSKILIPGNLAREAIIRLGSHALLDASGDAYPSRKHPSLFLAHFPVRSEKQFRRKVIDGWEAHCRNPKGDPNENFQWRSRYERCKDTVPISPEELQSIAMMYATLPGDAQAELLREPVSASPRAVLAGLYT